MTMNNPLTGRPVVFDWEMNDTRSRALDYMRRVADKSGVDFSLEPNHANKELLLLVLEQCDEVAAQKELRSDISGGDADPEKYEVLKRLCDQLLDASRCGVMQGVVHPEPVCVEDYNILFNTTHIRLDLSDVPYSPVTDRQISIIYELSSDDESVIKLTPNVQLSLFGDGYDAMVSTVKEEDREPEREIDIV